jgi:glutathione synthase/RimK-type ligase-like ATP-grasp enzyme
MKIGIHNDNKSYSVRWIEYCKERSIDYKEVNCFEDNIIEQLNDCDALLWHYYHNDYRSQLFAKQLLFALEQSGKVVFPNFRTGWHFDDKVGQKYLYESLGIKVPSTNIFYTREEALKWISTATFPKVFKLRKGASGSNVRLVRNYRMAQKLINKSFKNGHPQFNRWGYFKNRLNLFRNQKDSLFGVIKGFLRLFVPTQQERMTTPEKSYIFFQDYVPNEGFDYRIEIVGDYCIAAVRYVRKNDFRASGGHDDHFDKEFISKEVLDFAFDIYDKIKAQSCALDIIRNCETNELVLIENSYCYGLDDDEFLHGFWDRSGKWHNESFDGRDWMIETVINEILHKKNQIIGVK